MSDFKLIVNENGQSEMSFDKAEGIYNNIYLSLTIQRGSFFQNPDFGSRLHLLKRAKNTAQTAASAKDYVLEALRWLLDTGKAEKIEVEVERDPLTDPHRLKLLVTVTQADGTEVTFTEFMEVV